MARDLFQTTPLAAIARLAWALPAVVVAALIEAGQRWDFSIPVPFLALYATVTLAGAKGGRRAGIFSGSIAVLLVFLAYIEQFGPRTLTGGILQTALGAALFLMTGYLLGKLRDERDTSIRALRRTEQRLSADLQNEITEKSLQEEKVAASETRLNTAIRIAGIGHFSFEAFTGRCIFCSEQHATNLGMTAEEYLAIASGPEPDLSHVHPDDRPVVMEAIQRLNAGEAQAFEFRVPRSDGEVRYIRQMEEPKFDASGRVVEHIGMSMDLTDLRLAEARVRQSQRVEVIGTLTGGVAHDFNNLLAVILGNLELCLETDREDERREFIEAANQATNRGAALTQSLLSFARRAHLEPRRINLNQLIRDTMAWCTRVLPENVVVDHSLMAGLWDVELDPTSAENALINILLNARDAMPDGGRVTIETANMRIGDEYLSLRDEDIVPGRYVMLAISDTGAGIPEEKLERIFEPFYTGKPVGKGSGLGLSMVQGFIKQSGGAIRVYSEVGVGTTFKLYFQASEPSPRGAAVTCTRPQEAPGDRAEILVAEDEDDVRILLKRVLEGAGHAVTTARSGDEALGIFKSGGQFDLLLTDIVMPGVLQGPALAREIQTIAPDLPCIFLSGYASESTVHGNGLRPSDIRLMKPVSRDDLLMTVSRALKDNVRSG